jgi:hypothetical protein
LNEAVETKSCLSQGRISSPSLSNARAHHQGISFFCYSTFFSLLPCLFSEIRQLVSF